MTKKHKPSWVLFCREYLKDRNGKQAAVRAHYSPRSAEMQASRLLTKAKVRNLLKELERDAIRQAKIDEAHILKNVQKIAQEAHAAGEYTAALKAYEMLGKRMDLFESGAEKEAIPVKIFIERTDARSVITTGREGVQGKPDGTPKRGESQAHLNADL